MNERFELAPDKRYRDTHHIVTMPWLVGAWRKMPCLNYIVASLQCRKYAMYICGISFPFG